MFVLDTNTVIYFLKGKGNVAQNLLQTSPQNIAVPAIVLFEIGVGIAKSLHGEKRLQQINKLFSTMQVLSFGEPEATTSAKVRAALEQQGTPIGAYDLLIAGTTLANNGILVTHNTKEFKRVANLQLADWY